MKKENLNLMAKYALFIAIIFALGMTPLGLLNLPWAAITTLHIPVIIGAVMLGVRGGAILGTAFGIVSVIRCFTSPDAIATIILGFDSKLETVLGLIVILVIPRILVGIVAALLAKAFRRLIDENKNLPLIITSVAASATNSVFVLGFLTFLAYKQVGGVIGKADSSLLIVLGTLFSLNVLNIALEAFLAAVICTAVIRALRAFERHKESDRR